MTAPAPAIRRRPEWLQLLGGRDFRLMLMTIFGMDIGYYLRIAAQSWLVLELTDQQLWVGLVNAVRVAPILALSLVGGVVADRADRRNLLLIVRVGLGVVVLVTAVLVFTGGIRPWHLIVVSLALGVVVSFGSPAYYAFMFDLVGKSKLWVANSLAATVSNAGAVTGPVIAGAVLAGTGAGMVFLLAALLYAFGGVALLLIASRPKMGQAAPVKVIGELRSGLSYSLRTRQIRLLLLVSSAALFHSAIHPLLPVYARDVLDAGAAGYGLLAGAFGLGMFVGAVALAVLPVTERKALLVLGATLAWDICMALFGVSRVFALSLTLAFILGAAGAFLANALVTMLQTISSDEMRGRVMSIFSITAEFGTLGWLLGGALAQWIGNENALFVCAAAGAGATLLAFAASPYLRRS